MWLLEHVWLLPALMTVSFWVTLFVGKRMGEKCGWIGTASVAATLGYATVNMIAWISRKAVAEPEGEALRFGAGAARGLGRFAVRVAEEGGEHGAKLRPVVDTLWTWYHDGATRIDVGVHVDGFACVMLFTVAFISLSVHVYSLEYLKGDQRFTHYYAALSLFTGAMYILVTTASSLFLLFGWELMGLCSFLLIGHWWEKQDNTDAAVKAFLTTRTGDIGLLIGIVILYWSSGKTFDMHKINQMAVSGAINHRTLLVASVCLMFGVIGKSAQFPLHTWLPDAMAGPTPASALIHAATMVVAGVYVFARLYGVFWKGFSIQAGGMNMGALIGSITLVMAAALAFVQTDIKKVLAYSTVSQLGYMVMGLGVGAWVGAIFHLFTHAFFKALLFQGAGSVSHSGAHHSFEMERMGGLQKYMPTTYKTFFVGYLALAGVPPLAGFWSKDEILLGAWKNGYYAALAAGLLGSFMTACYMTRVMAKTFWGENRLHLFHDEHDEHAVAHDAIAVGHDDHGAHVVVAAHDEHGAHAVATAHAAVAVAERVPDPHSVHDAPGDHGDGHDAGPHESPRLILIPLVALAVMSAVVGLLQWPGWTRFANWTIDPIIESTVVKSGFEHEFSLGLAAVATLLGVLGMGVGYWYNVVKAGDLGILRRSALARTAHNTLRNKYYLDHLWTGVIIGSIKKPIAQGAYWFDQNGLDGIVDGVARLAKAIANFVYRFIDQGFIDKGVNGAGSAMSEGGTLLGRLQNGRVQSYAALFVGATGLIAFALALFL